MKLNPMVYWAPGAFVALILALAALIVAHNGDGQGLVFGACIFAGVSVYLALFGECAE